MVQHTGGLPGMLSKTVLIPDINLGIIILTNTSADGAGIFGSVSQALIDNYLGLDDFGWIDKYANYYESRKVKGDSVTQGVWKTVTSADASHINEKDYMGMYEDVWFGKVEVFKKGEQLWIKAHRSPKLKGEMYYYKAKYFRY